MGKKGKNKNQTPNVHQTTLSPEYENIEKEEKIQETVAEIPKVEQIQKDTKAAEILTEDVLESKDATLKSKKKRNRKKKNTATEINVEESTEENAENVNQKEKDLQTPDQVKSEAIAEPSDDTLKKKRHRNRKKNNRNVGDVQEEINEEISKNENSGEIISEKSGDDPASSHQNTLKRKRNRNKNKTTVNKEQNEAIVEVVEKLLENEQPQNIEAKSEHKEKPEPQRRGKKQKRSDLSSKKTILDELQDRQEREQKEARDHIKNEIAKREKLLETIDLVLDCHKTEAELAKNQQESLKDVMLLSQEAAKPRPQPLPLKSPKQSSSKKSTPVEDELVNKIEQVLGMTKLEIQNAQTQKAYVSRLEAEVAKVKQSKDILLGGQSSSAVPPHIQKMAKEMRDLTKGEVPKNKEELIKEIESRDVLMSEINRVLDNTKSEIDKVQKQQKIIQNLEVELNKMKDQEIVEKLMVLAEDEEPKEPPPPPKQSPATASLLDALMANVGKLKEIQAIKEKQKAEQSAVEISGESITNVTSDCIQKHVELHDIDAKVEKKDETITFDQNQKEKSQKKDAKRINNEKKQASLENSPKEQRKHPKDQKQQPQKVHETISKAEEMINSENKKEEISAKIEFLKECGSVEVKKESMLELSGNKNLMIVPECKSKTDDIKLEPVNSEKKEQKKRDHNKDKETSEKEIKKFEKKITTETNLTCEKTTSNQENNKDQKSEDKKIVLSDQEKTKRPDLEKNAKDVKHVMPVEDKATSLSESQEIIKNENNNDLNQKGNNQKKNDKEHKTSPKSSNKNKKHVLKGIPEVIVPISITAQKPSMAEMLKNAPDPPPDEINEEQNVELKIEAAPLAKPESLIIEINPSEQLKELMQSTMLETTEEKQFNDVSKELSVDDNKIKIGSEIQDDEIVIVNKVEVEAEMKEQKVNEQESTDPKNVQRGGFVSHAETKDTKPLKKDENQHANKNKSHVKMPTRPNLQKEKTEGKATQNKTVTVKPKLEVQAKISSKHTDVKKTQQSSTKSLSPTTEKPQPKFESANNVSTETPTSLKIDTQNSTHDISLPSTDKPKVPLRPDVTKTSNTKPAPRAGNVTNQPSSPIKTKTPSPSKSPSVSKPATTSTAQTESHAVRPKPTVSQKREPVNSKSPTKSTNQKPLNTPQKVNSTKTATPKTVSSMASATETK
ncbi:hypothetical protein ACKWTF_012252 [Chironomus riparius]